MTRRPITRLLALAAVLVSLTACGGDPVEDYCGAVEDHQGELGELVGEGGPTALLGALEVFRDLQDRAPSDIADEWQQVVGRLAALEEALEDAGLDPASYDRDDPPAGLAADDRSRIEAAARELVTPETATALEGLQQQSRDVCKTPLSL